MDRSTIKVDLPPKLAELLLTPARYKVAHGGRGSAKSWSFARALVAIAYAAKKRIMCGREIQKSIRDSVHKLLADQIDLLGLGPWFDVQRDVIYSRSGSEFIFAGLQELRVKSNVKSMEGIDILWVEEAETVSDGSWQIIIPTIRKRGSEIWVSYNPDLETDPTDVRFIKNTPPGARVIEVNWQDNPWFADSPEMTAEKDYLYRVDPEAAAHVWGGAYRTNSDAQVLRGKVTVEAFEPATDWDGPYFGADWGFSQDPTALIRFWVAGRDLAIEHEAYRIGCDIDQTPAMFDNVPGARPTADGKSRLIRADNARPETISYLQRHGYHNVTAAEKWSGSVEDGVAFLRQFERIVIHPRCVHTLEESRLWSYKRDRLTGDILPDLVDAHNHCWDAVRYGLDPLIRGGADGMFRFYEREAAKRPTVAPVALPQSFTRTQTGFPGAMKGPAQ